MQWSYKGNFIDTEKTFAMKAREKKRKDRGRSLNLVKKTKKKTLVRISV